MSPTEITAALRAGLSAGEPVRLSLDGATVFVDHAAPVLAVHRCPADATGDPTLDARAACGEAHRLVTTQPAYVLASGDDDAARATVKAVADVLSQRGPLLVVEVWTPLDEGHDDHQPDPFDRAPGFSIFTAPDGASAETVETLCDALSEIEIAGQGADVQTVTTEAVGPPGLAPLALGAPLIGLAVDAVFVNARDGEFYPGVLGALREALAPALGRSAAVQTGAAPADLGRQSLEPAAVAVDRGLGEVASAFGFLLQVTPVNPAEAWEQFRDGACDCEPEWLYRPLAFDADDARRRLFALPLDEVEDPTVHALLRECRDEIESHIRMILDIETPQFLPASLRVYGAPDGALVALAHDVVAAIDALPESPAGSEVVGATAFAAAARGQLEAYHALSDHVPVEVEVRDDIPGSLMVSRGKLLVGSRSSVPAERVQALLAHEVGTHVLTYANGCAQPLDQLRHGTAGYQDLQEGLAVFAEWLVGGLTPGRFRTLAARVIGADALARGADFVETFRAVQTAGLSDRAAFTVALRLRRGGGLTKDAVYLRGLHELLGHLGRGGEFWPLFVGKIALRHLPAVADLRQRGVLVEPPLRPLHADSPAALARLAEAQAGLSVLDLL